MKRNITQKSTKAFALALTAGILSCSVALVQAEILTGLTYVGGGAGVLFTINSSDPSTILNSDAITGTTGGEIIVGIDYFGGILYGVGSGGKLYNINQTTGVASAIGSGFGTLNGIYYGVDATAAGIRVVSDADINLLINSSTGALISSTPTLTPSSLDLTALSSKAGTTYAVDSLANTLDILNTSLGTVTTVGNMGYDVSSKNGFDISAITGVAYFASGVSSSATAANLYTMDLTTGATSLVGQIGTGELLVYGLTAVPEPSVAALFLAGGGGLGLLALIRRRK